MQRQRSAAGQAFVPSWTTARESRACGAGTRPAADRAVRGCDAWDAAGHRRVASARSGAVHHVLPRATLRRARDVGVGLGSRRLQLDRPRELPRRCSRTARSGRPCATRRVFAGAAVFIQVPVGVAWRSSSRRAIRGWKLLRTIYFLPNMVSGAALAPGLRHVLQPALRALNQVLGAFGFDGTRDWLFDVDTALPAIAATWVFTRAS